MLNSDFRQLCAVRLPYQGRQHYMHTFDLANPVMREGYEDYLEPVTALCRAAGAVRGTAHMTVDEKLIAAGMSQRKPLPHIDGCYMPDLGNWGGGGGGGWNHYCNHVPSRMPVILASSVAGCLAWRGKFEGQPREDGSCAHIPLADAECELLPAGVGYLLSPDCIHESKVFEHATPRTFLRIALPVDFAY
jgi:hypothetical protein